MHLFALRCFAADSQAQASSPLTSPSGKTAIEKGADCQAYVSDMDAGGKRCICRYVRKTTYFQPEIHVSENKKEDQDGAVLHHRSSKIL